MLWLLLESGSRPESVVSDHLGRCSKQPDLEWPSMVSDDAHTVYGTALNRMLEY